MGENGVLRGSIKCRVQHGEQLMNTHAVALLQDTSANHSNSSLNLFKYPPKVRHYSVINDDYDDELTVIIKSDYAFS